MTRHPPMVGTLYVLADVLFALLVGVTLLVPLAVPAVVWYLRR